MAGIARGQKDRNVYNSESIIIQENLRECEKQVDQCSSGVHNET